VLEAFAQVEGDRRRVVGAGLDDCSLCSGLGLDDGLHELRSYAAAESVGIDNEPVDVERSRVKPPGDHAREAAVEELLAAGPDLVECLPERRNAVGTDQVGLDSIGAPLQLEYCACGVRVGDVGMDDVDRARYAAASVAISPVAAASVRRADLVPIAKASSAPIATTVAPV
jgi:hypothetical protein